MTTTTTTTLDRVGGGQQRGTQWWQSNTPHVDEQCVVMVVCIMTIQCHTHRLPGCGDEAALVWHNNGWWLLCKTTPPCCRRCCCWDCWDCGTFHNHHTHATTTTTSPQPHSLASLVQCVGVGLARVGGTMKHKQGTEPTVLLLGDVVVVCLFGCEVCKCGCHTVWCTDA